MCIFTIELTYNMSSSFYLNSHSIPSQPQKIQDYKELETSTQLLSQTSDNQHKTFWQSQLYCISYLSSNSYIYAIIWLNQGAIHPGCTPTKKTLFGNSLFYRFRLNWQVYSVSAPEQMYLLGASYLIKILRRECHRI